MAHRDKDSEGDHLFDGQKARRSVGLISFVRRISTTLELGSQKIVLSPGASSTCDGNACCCTSCW